uniref:Uncharacterized protein n=1 Tax=Rhodopseudomonas palustris (strain ATCC BAA-98 / CGA009) TaxID=258594 RepID=Q6N164_RHOPA|nr:hypothetical protein RPA4545 [Rhodopseudomonas palustris CGA009]
MTWANRLKLQDLRQCASLFSTGAPELTVPVVQKRMPFLDELARKKRPQNKDLRQCASSKTTGANQPAQLICASAPVPLYRNWRADRRTAAVTRTELAQRAIPHERFTRGGLP